MKLAFQGINNHNASALDNDGMLDVVTTPHDVEVNLSLIGKSWGRRRVNASHAGKHPEIARLEQIFKVEIVGVLSGWYENGRIKSLLECRNAVGDYSELETDIGNEARESLPFIWDGPKPKQSAWKRWVGGEYPTEDWLENLFAHHEAKKIAARRSPVNARGRLVEAQREFTNARSGLMAMRSTTPSTSPHVFRESELSPPPITKEESDALSHFVDIPPANENTDMVICGDKPACDEVVDEIHCAICSRQLTNPTSRRLQIGPECRKRIGGKGLSYLQDDNVVSAELMEASKLYHEEQFRKWIIRACLTLDASLPVKVLRWLGNEWFSYRSAPILYYLSADGQLNRLDTYKRKLRHKVITQETAETELDSHAVRIASETNGNGWGRRRVNASHAGNGNGGRKLQMDKKLRTWLSEADGTKKEISCREIATQYDSYEKGILKRLRAGIDSGADISTVELSS